VKCNPKLNLNEKPRHASPNSAVTTLTLLFCDFPSVYFFQPNHLDMHILFTRSAWEVLLLFFLLSACALAVERRYFIQAEEVTCWLSF
jgi:hypothetical protein